MKRYTIDGDPTPSGYTFFVVAGRRRIASARTYQEAEKLAPAALRRFERYRRRRLVSARPYRACRVCFRRRPLEAPALVCSACMRSPAAFDLLCKRYGLSPRYDAAL